MFAFVKSDDTSDNEDSLFYGLELPEELRNQNKKRPAINMKQYQDYVNQQAKLKKRKQHLEEEPIEGKTSIDVIYESLLDDEVVSSSTSEVIQPSSETQQPASSAPSSKKVVKSGLDQALSKLNEKKKSTISQSKLDWKEYKEKEGIEHELQQYTKDGYLEKQAFLDRTEMREFEIGKDLRNKERQRREQQQQQNK